MKRVQEVADYLGCSGSNVRRLLRQGRIKGTRTPKGWMMTEEAVKEYLDQPKIIRPIKLKVEKGQKIGYWTVIDPTPKTDQIKGDRRALCQCVCGKIKLVSIFSLTHGESQSCGCRRAERMSARQLKGKENGHKLMHNIHQAGLAAKYIGKRVNKNSTSGHTGVSWMKSSHKYRAYIMVSRKQISLGLYAKLEDAIAARNAGEEKYYRRLKKKVNAIKREGIH